MRIQKIGHKKTFLITLFVIFIMAAISGYTNILLGDVTDLATAGDVDGVIEVAKIAFVVTFFAIFVKITSNYFQKLYIKKTLVDIKVSFMDTMLSLNPVKLYTMKHAKYVSHLTHDMDRLEHQYYLNVLNVMNIVVNLIVSIIILVRIWWGFLIVATVLMVVFMMIARNTSKPVRKHEEKKSKSLEAYTNYVEESLEGFEVIAQHQLEDTRNLNFEKHAETLKQNQYTVEKKMTLVDGLNGALQMVILVVLIVMGLSVSHQMGMSLGETIVIMILFSNLIFPIQTLTPIITQMNAIATVFSEFNESLKDNAEKSDALVSSFNQFIFEDASLGYDEPVLSKVNFEINRGEKVLIVGPSGAGKSTILKTLLRQIEPLSGAVRLNQLPLASYNLESYYGLISMVDQIGFIFSGTLNDNVTLLKGGDVKSILSDIGLSYLDDSMKLKNDGSNLSGGERARILLGRAKFFDKEIILCDEIYAALDESVGRQIESDILDTDKTVITISHIVFEENLDSYDRYLIVDNQSVKVSTDKQEVLIRMLEYELEMH